MWRATAALAVTQTVGYGTLYYAFAVLLQPMAAGLHASTTQVTGALTASVLAGAVMAVPVGRWLDRHGARALMTTGSVAATGLLVAWSRVRTLAELYAVLIGIGLTGAMVLYQPAFAVVVAWSDPARRARALLAVTVVAGFASSIFLPLTGVLVQVYAWRGALLILAAVHGLVTVALHATLPRGRPPPMGRPGGGHTQSHASAVRGATRERGFWILTVAFVAHGAAISAMTVHLVTYLASRGHPATFAATVAGLLGVLSVTGRLVLTGATHRLRTTTAVAAIFSIQALAAASLPIAAATRAGAIVAVVGFGLGFGVASLATPALLANRYGTSAYATIAGVLAVPVTLAKATAPLAAALLHTAGGGYTPVLAAIAGCCLLAAVGVPLSAGRRARAQRCMTAGRA